ncbi:DUF2267 domain-containing protein [Actinoplanes sp. NPDC051861]|uniref:DUF2267 domain-containing protein n=1 Tax=Actinoplanes sp. NPDC051861 TaxID=3155170 RepID=UPI00341823E0
MREREMAATVAENAGLAKQEAADLIRATLEGLGNQFSNGVVRELAGYLPAELAASLPQHDNGARPVPLADFIRQLSRRTGLTEVETERGVRSIVTELNETGGPALVRALSQLPGEYRRLGENGG